MRIPDLTFDFPSVYLLQIQPISIPFYVCIVRAVLYIKHDMSMEIEEVLHE